MRPLAKWSPVASAWLTLTDQLCGHSAEFSETWPTSGMTLGGLAYELPTWAPVTDGSASLSSPGLPTPRAHETDDSARSTRKSAQGADNLGTVVLDL